MHFIHIMHPSCLMERWKRGFAPPLKKAIHRIANERFTVFGKPPDDSEVPFCIDAQAAAIIATNLQKATTAAPVPQSRSPRPLGDQHRK